MLQKGFKMSQDYHYQIVVDYDGQYPLDENGHYLDPSTIKPVEGHPTHWFPITKNGRKYVECRNDQERMKSPREVALDSVCHREKLGRKRKFFWAKVLTNPYGSLHYAIGSGDDFWCFDYAKLVDGRVIVHSTINSETGGFIMRGEHEVVPENEAPDVAMGMIDQAITWCCENDVRITRKRWYQDPYYFYRSVFQACDKLILVKPRFSDREMRLGGKRVNRYCGLNFLVKEKV